MGTPRPDAAGKVTAETGTASTAADSTTTGNASPPTRISRSPAIRALQSERPPIATAKASVLMKPETLALIQNNADDPTVVARLARAQERDLRSWLFEAERLDEATVAGELRRIAADVEDAYGVPVDLVTVGDAELTEALTGTDACVVPAF